MFLCSLDSWGSLARCRANSCLLTTSTDPTQEGMVPGHTRSDKAKYRSRRWIISAMGKLQELRGLWGPDREWVGNEGAREGRSVACQTIGLHFPSTTSTRNSLANTTRSRFTQDCRPRPRLSRCRTHPIVLQLDFT
jgi:hypothetical protein